MISVHPGRILKRELQVAEQTIGERVTAEVDTAA